MSTEIPNQPDEPANPPPAQAFRSARAPVSRNFSAPSPANAALVVLYLHSAENSKTVAVTSPLALMVSRTLLWSTKLGASP